MGAIIGLTLVAIIVVLLIIILRTFPANNTVRIIIMAHACTVWGHMHAALRLSLCPLTSKSPSTVYRGAQ